MSNVFQDLIFEVNDDIFQQNTAQSRDWLRKQAAAVRESQAKKDARDLAAFHGKNLVRAGHMHMFQYLPATREKLPFYDMFPVVFPFRRHQGGFHAINLHYLPHNMRAILMDNLYKVVSESEASGEMYLKAFTYKMLNSSSRFRFFKPCVRQYLNKNVISRFIYVPFNQWEIALFLPLERFRGATKKEVFQHSREIIRDHK